MTSVSVDISVDANGELWSMRGQLDVKKTVIIGRSGLPGKGGRRAMVVEKDIQISKKETRSI